MPKWTTSQEALAYPYFTVLGKVFGTIGTFPVAKETFDGGAWRFCGPSFGVKARNPVFGAGLGPDFEAVWPLCVPQEEAFDCFGWSWNSDR
mmetsp:Transcript_10886/g.21333  ORF Transcript_10886/g.21333 Transcript_10886/m.21333 type:complete len:91 (+) Transcript_10886:2466-2738(+)